jgi:hypothetical protein
MGHRNALREARGKIPFRSTVAAALLLFSQAPGLAQGDACRRLRGELARLEETAGEGGAAALSRAFDEIARLDVRADALGCDGISPGSMAGRARPECRQVARRRAALEAGAARLGGRMAQDDPTEERRQDLRAAIDAACLTTDDPLVRGSDLGDDLLLEPGWNDDHLPGSREAGGRLVCVRACDGYFFPLDAQPAHGDADGLCQALCPGAATSAFRLPRGPTDLLQAVSSGGQAYRDLPNAFRYQRRVDPTCACKREGESWTQVLRQAEAMLANRAGEVTVTAQRSDEMARPRQAPAGRKQPTAPRR